MVGDISDDSDFKATVRQNKRTGQKSINIPESVSHKYPTGEAFLWKGLAATKADGEGK